MNAIKIIALILLLGLIGVSFYLVNTIQHNKALEMQNQEMNQSFEEATRTIADIQSSLDAISPDMLKRITSNPEVPDTSITDKKSNIINSISQLNNQMQSYKDRIAELERKLNSSDVRFRGLQVLVQKLKESLTQKEELIAELSGQINVLNQTIVSERETHKGEIRQKDEAISEKENVIKDQLAKLNTMYYIVGSQKELLEKGVIERTGGVLGLGKVVKIKANFRTDQFTRLSLADTQQITIPQNLARIAILSSQNQSSYSLSAESPTSTTLKVTDPETFSQVRYLIIMTKK